MHTIDPHNLSLRRRAGKRCRPLLAAAAAVVAVAPATAEEMRVGPPAPGIHIKVPDIRGDLIRRMREGLPLERPREEEDTGGPETGPEPAAAATGERPDTASAPQVAPASEDTPERKPGADRTAPRQRPVYIPPPRRDEHTDDGHVPVPKKTLTIRQLQDVDRLGEELERARKRQDNGSQ